MVVTDEIDLFVETLVELLMVTLMKINNKTWMIEDDDDNGTNIINSFLHLKIGNTNETFKTKKFESFFG